MKIKIFGAGMVGGALLRWFKSYTTHEVLVHDPRFCICESSDAEYFFICVPAITFQNGLIDLSNIINCLQSIKKKEAKVFIRCTLTEDDYKKLEKDFSDLTIFALPEFLTERTCDDDMRRNPIIVGLPEKKLTEINFLNNIFPVKQIIIMSREEACLVKYAHNCMGAVKVTFFNIIRDLCESNNLNYLNVITGVLASGYINQDHTQVPGPDGKYGYGGACFPKDMLAFSKYLSTQNNGTRLAALIDATISVNDGYFRKK